MVSTFLANFEEIGILFIPPSGHTEWIVEKRLKTMCEQWEK